MGIIINMLPPTVRITHTLPNMHSFRERDRMAREFALIRAKPSLPNISLHTSDLGRPCLVDIIIIIIILKMNIILSAHQ